ncbi:MAG: hypothetical protein ACE37F_09180 [Nannocystaceae bacterium]|nr:hypothetical protein [bacterium]
MSLRVLVFPVICALALGCGDDSSATESADDSAAGTSGAEAADGSTGTDSGLTAGVPETDTDIDPSGDTLDAASCDPRLDECGDGFKCGGDFDFLGEPAFECVPVVSDAQPGDSCEVGPAGSGSDTCAAGSYCLGGAGVSMGTCASYCDADDSCGESDLNCISVYGLGLPLCLADCDPLDLAGCPDGWTCREDQSERSWYCAPDLEEAAGGHGESCVPTSLGLCDPGFSCRAAPVVDADACLESGEGTGCCAQLCNLDDDAVCPGELEECLPYYPEGGTPPINANLGVCAVPVGE